MTALRAVALSAVALSALIGPTVASAEPTPAPKPAAEPTLTQLSEQAIVRRRVTATPAELEARLREAFFALVGEAMNAKWELAGPPLARYQARGTTAEPEFIIDAALPLRTKPRQPAGPGFAIDQLPAGPAATLLHRGRLADLPRSHAMVDAWLSANHRRAVGPRWEVFVTNPVTTPDPNAQQVTIVVPLAPQ